MADLFDNPMGTDGFEFVEYTAPDPELLRTLFERMGFPVVARHRSKNVTLHRQGDINFIINAEPGSFGQRFAQAARAVGMRDGVSRERCGRRRSSARWSSGATPVEQPRRPDGAEHPGHRGHRRQRHLSRRPLRRPHDLRRRFRAGRRDGASSRTTGPARLIDHLTHNVQRGNMGKWAGFYERLFNFREIRYFDIEGRKTGLLSRAMTSPCGKIRIPINESQDDKSQIEEYLREYHGEGIQHIALSTDDIYAHGRRAAAQRRRRSRTRRTPTTRASTRACTGTARILDELRRRRILIDGSASGQASCCRSSRRNVIGPIFFEIIQRKGNEGFGEGNFRALFESIELDQERRGVI